MKPDSDSYPNNSAPPASLVQYLRECYRENSNSAGLTDVFHERVYRRYFFSEKSDWFTESSGGVDNHVLRGEAIADLCALAKVYQKECDLLYASIFVAGAYTKQDNSTQFVCAPIVLCPLKINLEVNDTHAAAIDIDTSQRYINLSGLTELGGDEFAQSVERLFQSNDSLRFEDQLVEQFQQQFEKIEFIDQTSELADEKSIRSVVSKVKKQPELGPFLITTEAVLLVGKSVEMRGVLNELEAMSKDQLSPPIRALLGESSDHTDDRNVKGRIPAHLSTAQKKILDSSKENPLTVAIGPPGTGKSFTIAALAIEAMSRGKSVIISSKMDHAVDVAGDKIESAIGLSDAIVRCGRKGYLRKLKAFIKDLNNGLYSNDVVTKTDLHELNQLLDFQLHNIGMQECVLKNREKLEIKFGRLMTNRDPNWWNSLRINWMTYLTKDNQNLHTMAEELYEISEQYIKGTVKYLSQNRLYDLRTELQTEHKSFKAFEKAIRSTIGTKADKHFDQVQWDSILKALPIWLVNFSDVYKVLPYTPEMFDLAIIDEASQCDMASVLPILQRAKRAVIAGDPAQLRHISFLPTDRQTSLANQYGLNEDQVDAFDFRNRSLLDLASDKIEGHNQIAFLDEHFRSRPEIIQFCNQEFYRGKLKVMTGNHLCPHHIERHPPISIIKVDRGERLVTGVNEVEGQQLLDDLVSLVNQRDTRENISIGILSPFRAQVDWLRSNIAADPNKYGWIIERNKLLIGTAHTFQGEERDWMFISTALDDKSHPGSYRFLDKRDLFNVTVTRAKNRIFLYHTFELATLSSESLWGRYINYSQNLQTAFEQKTESTQASRQHKSEWFAKEVAIFLESQGAKVTIGYSVAGQEVDLVYTLNGETLGIDLVGYPGTFTNLFPLERVFTFQRANLRIYPIAYSEWKNKRADIEQWLLTPRL